MSSGPEWTEEQLRAIERREGDLLLDAGAGSGKTSVLVERFVRAVLEDGVDVSAILTITFTEKAAAELRDRIRVRLGQLGAVEAARQTESAFISTIHGFCARVLRAHALAAGLDPSFVVLDRSESEPLGSAAFEDALQELADGAEGAVDLVAGYGAGPLRGAILGAYAQLRSGGAIAPELPPCPASSVEVCAGELGLAATSLARELGAISTPSPRVIDALARVQRCLDLVGIVDLWPVELERVKLPRNGAALSTDACVAYSEALARFRAQCATRAAAPVRELLDRLLVAYTTHYARRKRAASGLDFEDLELITRQLLKTDEELREHYATRFERIMVDELQDTNRVQLELIESIARGNLFTVGDGQQSIYGFRHADVELFERRGERLAAVGARETLQTNFRSRPAILGALNLAFADELGERFKPLRAGRPDAPDTPPRVELVIVDKGADWALEGLASPWRLAEGRALADRVAELVADGAAPGEIVVLMRATTDMRAYERALERRGLPTYVIGGRGYWSHPQVVDLVSYLRALANPRDEESLYGVLSSPLVGVSLDALVVLGAGARASGRDPWWVLREPGGQLEALQQDDRAKLAAFASWFAAERVRAARSAIEELIDSALEQTGYDVAMLAMPGGKRRLANVRKLMRLGREHERVHGCDLRGFLELVADREAGRASDSRESEAPVEGDGLDAIRLMTIHRAKGLEFKIVCVADLGRVPRRSSELLRVDGDGRLGLRLARAGVAGREPALDFKSIGDQQQRTQESEERRLFYVAMTRAQERLILSGAAKFEGWTGTGHTGGGPIAWIAPAFVPELGALIEDGGGVIDRDGVRIAVRVGRPEDDHRAATAAALPPLAPRDSVPRALVTWPAPPPVPPPAPPVATLSYSSLGEYARCGYRFYVERVLGLPEAPESRAPAVPIRGPRSAADRGVLLHALLERLDFRRPAIPSPAAIVAAAERAGLWPAPGPAEADELVALVRQFAGSELCARLGRASDARREERFAFPLTGGVLVVGALDVLAREPGELALIVDYKSDRLARADPAAVVRSAYATQRLVYALAGLHTGAEQVEIAHCFLERPAEPVTATFSRSQAAELEAELHGLTRGVLAREFTVAPAPYRELCSGCPAEGGLCSWPLEQTRREAPDRLF
jgi:ATP-dependent helicase/nuclease subunit A